MPMGNAPATQSDIDAGTDAGKFLTSALKKIALVAKVATTSGTAWNFTGIPAGVRKVWVYFGGFSGNGTSIPLVQVGYSGGVANSGYTSVGGNGFGAAVASTAGFILASESAASYSWIGCVELSLADSATNTWIESGHLTRADVANSSAGSVALSGELDRVRVTFVNGTDTGDAGWVALAYAR